MCLHPQIMDIQFAREYGHHLHVDKGRIVGLQAPTGSGKSTGVYWMVKQNRTLFGRTLFIFPTSMALHSIIRERTPHIFASTPQQAIHNLVTWKHAYDTIIVDEAHVPSTEYFTIFRILYYLRRTEERLFRLVLLSATLDQQALSYHFHQEPIDFIEIPSNALNKRIDIVYTADMPFLFSPSFFHTLPFIVRAFNQIVKKSLPRTRIIVFLASHDQCERTKQKIQTDPQGYRVICMHGGMDEDEIEANRHIMRTEDRWVCMATNMIETAVTLVDVNFVIDSCVRCVVDNNSLVIKFCDKVSCIQRAGRTGRTCDGIVYRILSEEQFSLRPYQEYPVHNFEKVALRIFNSQRDPFDYLQERVIPAVQLLRQLGIVYDGGLVCFQLGKFLGECGLTIRIGQILYQWMKRGIVWDTHNQFFMIVLAIINYYDSKPVHLLYFPPNVNRFKIIQKIYSRFVYLDDLLMTVLHIFVSIFCSVDAKKTAGEYSLNFKTLREILSHYNKILRILGSPKSSEEWFIHMRTLPLPVVAIRQFMVMHYSPEYGLPFLRDPDDYVFCRDRLVTYGSGYESLFRHKDETAFVITPLVKRQRFDLFDNSTEFILWTLPPHDYRLGNNLSDAILAFAEFQFEKALYRGNFKACIEDIERDVAYRPGFYRPEEFFQTWLNLLTNGLS